jgi:hypothetical protein
MKMIDIQYKKDWFVSYIDIWKWSTNEKSRKMKKVDRAIETNGRQMSKVKKGRQIRKYENWERSTYYKVRQRCSWIICS